MKLFLLSCFGIVNYGSILLTLATQKKMQEYFDEIETVHNPYCFRLTDKIREIKNPLTLLNDMLVLIFFRRHYLKAKKRFGIEKDYFCCSDKDFEKINPQADVYCTGSDQIWRIPKSHKQYAARFLSFVPNGKRKISYVSSFGYDHLDSKDIELTQDLINQYERISVREDSAVKILDQQYGYKNVIQLVDPTLAMPPEFWRQYSNKSKIKGNYILLYLLNRNKALDDYALKLSKKTGMPLIRLCPRLSQIFSNGKKIVIPPVFDFIALIDNAKYVLTDSFHGLAFSVNLNTEPIVSLLTQDCPDRLASLLRLLDSGHRAITDFNDLEVLNRPVNWERVNAILDKERERVDEFLSDIFNK